MSIKALVSHLKPLQTFLHMEGVTEICINKPYEVYVEINNEFKRYTVDVLSFEHLQALAELVAEFNQQEISPEKPLISASLPNGERVQFVISPACEKNHVICAIRRYNLREMTLDNYIDAGAFDNITANETNSSSADDNLRTLYRNRQWPEFIKTAIVAKKNIIIAGGTGTGKTTFLNACLKLIPMTERLITIEDTREVSIHQPNHVHLLAVKGQQGLAKIRMQDLFECCLRLRPDRIFLSELRGEEAFAFLRAANSGHPGSISTIHADSPQGCFEQLIFMMQQAGSTSSDERILSYVKSIIPIIIQLKRSAHENRFMSVSEIYFNGSSNAS